MTRLFSIMAIGLFVAACTNQSVQTKDEDKEFFVTKVGAYSDLNLPEFMRVHYPTRFNHSIEPSIFDTIGSEMENAKIEDFCARESTDRLIINDCKLINEESPHAEFYLSQYNPYNEDYTFIGKYALFKTPSIVHPALLIELPLSGPSADKREVIEEFFISESRMPGDPGKTKSFTDFVRSIKFENLKSPEPELLTFEDSEKGFLINYPNGLDPVSYGDDNVFSLGPDRQFAINYYPSKTELDARINSFMDHDENRTVNWSQAKVGKHDAEKVTYSIGGRAISNEIYVVKAKSGYLTLSYDENYFEGFNDMLHTFQLLE